MEHTTCGDVDDGWHKLLAESVRKLGRIAGELIQGEFELDVVLGEIVAVKVNVVQAMLIEWEDAVSCYFDWQQLCPPMAC
jgi:hypothetical protein